MKSILFSLLLLPALLWSQPVPDHNYYWFTGSEHSPQFPFDIIRFFGRDTLWGAVRSNDCIAFQNVAGWPTFYDTITMSCDSSQWQGPFPIPDNIIFNAPQIPFPDSLTYIRERGPHLYVPGHEWYVSIRGAAAYAYHYPEGTELDTLNAQSISFQLSPRAVVFIDGKVDMRGVMNAEWCNLILGCSQDIRLIDNVMLEGTNTVNGTLPSGATSRIAIASEQGIIVANTWQNGRNNRTGTPPNNRDICITAYLSAIGTSFQFEQMNDVGDPYIGPTPDERGNIVLTGGITQRYRGYTHRSNNGGTGYNKVYHYDERLRHWRIGVFEPFDPFIEDPIYSDASDPLFPAQFTLAVSPNPFNASTTIRFTLPQAGNVRAVVYDVLGREVVELADRQYPEGSHTMQIDGSAWSSGVYFLSFSAGGNASTHKLLLLK